MKENKDDKRNFLSQYKRILRIDRLLSDETYPTLQDLENDHEIEMSRATIYRMIEFMRDQLNAPIVKDPKTKGWYYSDKTFRLPIIFTSEKEMIATATLKNMLLQLEGTPLYDSAKKVLDLIENSTVKNPTTSFELADGDSKDPLDLDWILKRYVFLDDKHGEVTQNVWDKIFFAMKKNNVIEFDYIRGYDNANVHRKVAPYQVLKLKEDWTLWAKDFDRNDYRLFAMGRISNIKIMQQIFVLPEVFEYSKITGSKDDIWYNSEEIEFKIWVSDEIKDEIEKDSWGRQQKLSQCTDNNGFELFFTTSNYDRTMKKVLSYAEWVKPLSPANFVEDYKNHIKNMLLTK